MILIVAGNKFNSQQLKTDYVIDYHQKEVLFGLCCAMLSFLVMSDSAIPWTVACQAPLSVCVSRQEFWNGLSCPPPGDLSNPGIEPRSPPLHADSLLPELPK